jgi:hypothetical protein
MGYFITLAYAVGMERGERRCTRIGRSGAETETEFLSLRWKSDFRLYYFRQIQLFHVTFVEYIFYFVINKKIGLKSATSPQNGLFQNKEPTLVCFIRCSNPVLMDDQSS